MAHGKSSGSLTAWLQKFGPSDRFLFEALRAHRIDRRAPVSRHAVARSSMPHEVALPGNNLSANGPEWWPKHAASPNDRFGMDVWSRIEGGKWLSADG